MSGMSNHSAYVKICVRLYLTYSGKVCILYVCMYVCAWLKSVCRRKERVRITCLSLCPPRNTYMSCRRMLFSAKLQVAEWSITVCMYVCMWLCERMILCIALGMKSTPTMVKVYLYANKSYLPSALEATVSATYLTSKGYAYLYALLNLIPYNVCIYVCIWVFKASLGWLHMPYSFRFTWHAARRRRWSHRYAKVSRMDVSISECMNVCMNEWICVDYVELL